MSTERVCQVRCLIRWRVKSDSTKAADTEGGAPRLCARCWHILYVFRRFAAHVCGAATPLAQAGLLSQRMDEIRKNIGGLEALAPVWDETAMRVVENLHAWT